MSTFILTLLMQDATGSNGRKCDSEVHGIVEFIHFSELVKGGFHFVDLEMFWSNIYEFGRCFYPMTITYSSNLRDVIGW